MKSPSNGSKWQKYDEQYQEHAETVEKELIKED